RLEAARPVAEVAADEVAPERRVEERARRVALDVGVEAVAGGVGRELGDDDSVQGAVPSGGFFARGVPSGRFGWVGGRCRGTPSGEPAPFEGGDPCAAPEPFDVPAPFAPLPSASCAAAPGSSAGAVATAGPVPSAMRLIL